MLFTEFLELVEDQYGIEVADRVIQGAKLPNGGAYTAVGTYQHQELLALIRGLSQETGAATHVLMEAFGKYLFEYFSTAFPHLFNWANTSFDFLWKVDDIINVEVRKLYPDAELPRFQCVSFGEDRLELVYTSSRPLADLAEGLIKACVWHYKEVVDVEREDLDPRDGTSARFLLTVREGAVKCAN